MRYYRCVTSGAGDDGQCGFPFLKKDTINFALNVLKQEQNSNSWLNLIELLYKDTSSSSKALGMTHFVVKF